MKSIALAVLSLTMLCATPGFAQEIELADFPSVDGVRFVGNNPNSFPAQTMMPAGDVNGDGYDDLLFGSPLQNPDSGVYVAFGNADLMADVNLTSFANSATSAGFRMYDPNGDTGTEVSPAGDFNNDGYDDILLMGWNGRAYLVYGHAGSFSNINLAQPSDSFVKFENTGQSGAGIGDFNNDGFDDIVLGYESYMPVYTLPNSGRIWVIFGRENLSSTIDLTNFETSDENGFTVTGRTNGNHEGNFAGTIYPLGDFNGDGYSDFAVAKSMGRPTINYYTRMIFLGKKNGFRAIDFNEEPDKSTLPEGCIAIIDGLTYTTGQTYAAGSATGTTMDFNADGLSDLLIGGISNYSVGKIMSFVVFGRDDKTTSIILSDITTESTQGLQLTSPPGQSVGTGFSWGGDINHDGFADIILTENDMSFNEIEKAGCAYVIWGKPAFSGVFDLTDFIPGLNGFIVNGEIPNPLPFVLLTSPAGDVNGDSYDDFMLSITNNDPITHNTFGINYLLKGRTEARVGDWKLFEK